MSKRGLYKIVKIHPEDAHYGHKEILIGKRMALEYSRKKSEGWQFALGKLVDTGSDIHFNKVALSEVKSNGERKRKKRENFGRRSWEGSITI